MKRFFTTIIAISLAFNALALNVWDGSSEPWTQGDGTYNNPYLIETAANLAYLAEKVNEGYQAQGMAVFRYTYFLMTDDFDLNNINWTPIGNVNMNMEGYYFAGIFDGWYHNIDNLTIQSSADVCGLFAGLGGDWCGIIGNDDYGQIKHLSVTNGNIISTGAGAGGIVGAIANDAYLYQCSFEGSISVNSNGSYCGAGGIVAAAAERARIEHCSFSGSINATNNGGFTTAAGAGGIVGIAMNKARIKYCYNTGSVTASAMLLSVAAGIVGATLQENEVTIESCYNVGTLSGATQGGIFGMISPINPTKDETSLDVSNCYYLNTCGGTTSYGTSKTSAEMQTEEFKNTIDEYFHAFVMDNGTNNGYPIHGLSDFRVLEATAITHNSANISADINVGNDDATALILHYYDIEDGYINNIYTLELDIEDHIEVALEDLMPETEYGYHLQLESADGGKKTSNPHYFFTEFDGIAEISTSNIQIYPNPTSDFIFIENIGTQPVSIYSLDGRLVKTVEAANVIDVRDLENGMYLINIDGTTTKLVINK